VPRAPANRAHALAEDPLGADPAAAGVAAAALHVIDHALGHLDLVDVSHVAGRCRGCGTACRDAEYRKKAHGQSQQYPSHSVTSKFSLNEYLSRPGDHTGTARRISIVGREKHYRHEVRGGP
jgi:hypothetical protein